VALKAGTGAEITDGGEDGKRDHVDREYLSAYFSILEHSERRVGLRRLDDAVEALEELNLREAGKIPTSLKEKLVNKGIPIHSNRIAELIDVVLGSQELFLLKERRIGLRRRRRRFLPSDEELVSVISRRYQR
jgi:hypothetical protein